jgi:uncharacterized protein (TIGR03437 family)
MLRSPVLILCTSLAALAADRRDAIVVLEAPPVVEFLLSTRTAEDRAAARPVRDRLQSREAKDYGALLRAGKAGLVDRLVGRGIVVGEQTETVLNAIMVRATAEDLAWIRAQPGVRSAEFAAEYTLYLDAAVQLVGAPQLWTALGGPDNAGRGLKIGIIDSGIDQTHPMFDPTGFTTPQGYPLGDSLFTNAKVIVARNLGNDTNPADKVGHGTFVASVAAGRQAAGPLATVRGVAPGAFLGNYRVTNVNGSASESSVTLAVDRAVQDGMDILNISLGRNNPPTLALDPNRQAIANAVNAGVLVVVAAGNCGPNGSSSCNPKGNRTVGTPGTLPESLTVGASTNSRTFAQAVRVTAPAPVPAALAAIAAVPGNAPVFTSVGPAALVNVSSLQNDSLACDALPGGSLTGRIAVIQRGTCAFSDKIGNAQRAGAIGVIVYNNVSGLFAMDTQGATLPSVSITDTDGAALVAFVTANPGTAQALLDGQMNPQPIVADRVSDFSSRGPTPDSLIKPDVLAPGGDIYAGTQSQFTDGELHDATRFTIRDGTSFSSPMVAGAAALVWQSRRTLTPQQLKSALVNTATAVSATQDGAAVTVMNMGAGRLNLPAANSAAVVADPVSLSYGLQPARVTFSRPLNLRLTNIGTQTDTFNLSATPRNTDPGLSVTVNPAAVTLGAGSSTTVTVTAGNTAILDAAYEGFINIRSAATSAAINVPYWVSWATPLVNSGGVVNAASFRANVAPGSIVSVFGTGLGGDAAGATSLPLPTSLGGTSVRVSAANVPLFFVSRRQINLQLPFETPVGAIAGRVTFDGISEENVFTFSVVEAIPGIFTTRQDGTGPGAILRASDGQLITTTNRARSGDFVSIFCTGLGAVSNAPAPGAAAGSSPLSSTTTQPTVTIGGVNAAVSFSGLAPNFVSLYQVNVQIPTGLAAGEHPVVITMGGVASNPATIAVQ